VPDLGERSAADPAAPVCRPKLGHGAAVDGDGERLTGFDAMQNIAHLIAQLVLRECAHETKVALLLPERSRTMRPVCSPGRGLGACPGHPVRGSRSCSCPSLVVQSAPSSECSTSVLLPTTTKFSSSWTSTWLPSSRVTSTS